MWIIFVILIAFGASFNIRSQIAKEDREYMSSSQCIVKSIKRYFEDNSNIVMIISPAVNGSSSIDIPKLFQDDIAVTVRSTDSTDEFTSHYRKCNYIIYTRNQKELESVVDMLSKLSSWNGHSEFLVVSPQVRENPGIAAIELSEVIWKKDVAKVAVLLPGSDHKSEYEIYSWNPFRKPNHGPNNRNISPVDYCSFGVFKNDRSWLGKQLEACTNNCTLRMNYIEWPPYISNGNKGLQKTNYVLSQGFDLNVLNMIANKLNLTLLYNETHIGDWGNVYENGSIPGNLGLLLNSSVDILTGGYRKTSERISHFDMTDAHIEIFEVWCVPNTPVVVGFKSMTNILRKEVWILIISMYSLVSACTYLSSSRESNESTVYKDPFNILTINFAILLGVGVSILPRSTKARYFIALFILLGFYVTQYYSGYLTSILSAPKFVQKYNSLNDIYKYNLQIYFLKDVIKWIPNDRSITSVIPLDVILRTWKGCPNLSWCFKRVATRKDTCFYIDNLIQGYYVGVKGYSMHCIRHRTIGIPIAIPLRRGSPWLEPFNDIINRILEAGFVTKWRRDIFRPERWVNFDISSDDSRIMFVNLVPIFKFLLAGYAVSFLVLLVEIVLKWMGKI